MESLWVKKSAQVLRALNHPLRQHILKLLHLQGPLIVSELYGKLHLEQSVASQHLAILREARFVHTERQGKYIFYRLNYDRLQEVHQLCRQMLA